MMARTCKCRKCGLQSFECVLRPGAGTDIHVYIELICIACNTPMQFVVDLTPEFERDEHYFSRPARS